MPQVASGSTGPTTDVSEEISAMSPTGMDTVPAGMSPASIQQSEKIAISPQGILPIAVSQTQEFADDCSPKESIPHAVDSNCFDFGVKSPRIFLDICSGVSSPLSNALQKLQCDTMSFDILISEYDLLDDIMYERLLRLCVWHCRLFCSSTSVQRAFSFETQKWGP